MPTRAQLSMLMSIADPELKTLALKIASAIPGESPFRSRIAQRLFGVLKAWVESKAEELPPFKGALLEKLTDLGDFLVPDNEAAPQTVDSWVDRFFTEAQRRLAEATDPQAEAKRIHEEFALLGAICREIEDAQKNTVRVSSSGINWAEIDERLKQAALPINKMNERLATIRDGLKSRAQKRKTP